MTLVSALGTVPIQKRWSCLARPLAVAIVLAVPLTQAAAQHGLKGLIGSTEVDVGASGGLVNGAASSAIDVTGRTVGTIRLAAIRSLRAGIQSRWQLRALEADAGIALGTAAAANTSASRALGNVHVGTCRGPLSLSIGFEQSLALGTRTRDSSGAAPPGDTLGSGAFGGATSSPNMVRAEDLVGALGIHTPLATMRLAAGLRTNDRTNDRAGVPWLGASVGVGIGATSALAITGHLQRHDATIRTPALSVGFRTAYQVWSHTPPPVRSTTTRRTTRTPRQVVSVEPVGDSLRVRLYLPDARHPAVMGDATDWRPVPLRIERDAWWSVIVPRPTSVSRIQLLGDDGVWGPVPGLATTRDEYGGIVSLLMTPTH